MIDQAEQSYANWILKFVGISVGFIYSVGFMVVARYFSRYGVSTFSVFQSQYLVAGVWTVSIPIAFALVQRTTSKFSDKADRFGGFSWRRLILVRAMIGVPFGLLAAVSAVLLGGSDQGFTWSLVSSLWLLYLLLAASADLVWMSWQVPETATRWWLNRHATPYYLTVFALGILLWALYFATSVYPSIPSSLGGGKPQIIIFIPGRDGLPEGIAKGESSGRSVPYKLLTITDRSYVVISPNPNEQSIEINRDAVQGMIVLNQARTP
jgi:hypothetical protein